LGSYSNGGSIIAILLGIHVLICVALVIVVLLQSGKGTGLASVFGGGGGGGAVFGSKSTASFLSKATSTLAVCFMLTSLSLALFSSRRATTSEGVLSGKFRGMEQVPAAEQTFEPPAVPLSAEEAMLQGDIEEASPQEEPAPVGE
jgi:preprotein translocase subunit SecG